jgi:hypothetical protein
MSLIRRRGGGSVGDSESPWARQAFGSCPALTCGCASFSDTNIDLSCGEHGGSVDKWMYFECVSEYDTEEDGLVACVLAEASGVG